MKIITTILCLGTAAFAADAIHVSAGAQLRVTGTNATAAYSIDNDCAEVEVDGGVVIISGKRPCTTHVVTLADGTTIEHEVFVSPRPEQLERIKAARMHEQGMQESGYISTMYSSDPGQVETTLNMSRTQGGHTASVAVSVANGHSFSPEKRQTALPLASLRFASSSTTVTLLDSFVEQSPLTLSGTDLRGLHIQSGPWFLHAGIASLTNFRQRMFDPDPDRTIDAGYRFGLTRHSGLIASTQWVHASPSYASGRSGVIGSLMYDYLNPERLRLQLELGMSEGAAGAGLFDFFGSKDRMQVRVRSTPLHFPGLSAAPARGFQGSGNWTHQLTGTLGVDFSGTRDTYRLLDGTTQANTSAAARMQWRLGHFTLSGGFDHAELSRRNAEAIVSNAVPVGLAFDTQHFGNSIQYQYRRNDAADLGSYLVRDSMRINSGPVRFTFYGSRQTQAPTLDYVVGNVPGLRQALLEAGVTATTPEDILDFIRAHADLIGGGLITNLNLNLAPVRNEYGGTFNWTVRRNLLSLDFGYREVDDQRIIGRVTSRLGSGSLSVHLTPTTTLDVTGSLLETQAPGSVLRTPLLAIGLRRQLGSVPGFLNYFQQLGWIRGEVFVDEDGHTAGGMEGVTVVLDGVRRTHTDKSGVYYFHSVMEGKHSVDVEYQSAGSYIFTTAPHVETDENTVVNFGISTRKALLFGSVRNDGGLPLSKAVIHITGVKQEQIRTTDNGSFRFNLTNGGTYTVTLDAQSLPPSYDFNSFTQQTAHVEVNEPARVHFVVRAFRSIRCSVTCTGAQLDNSKVDLRIDIGASVVIVDGDGKYKISNLSSGPHELTFT